MIALYPGTFDLLTNGHLDLIERGALLFDELVVAIAGNDAKGPLFTLDERLDILAEATARFENVRIGQYTGLTAEYAAEIGARVILRGLRSANDLEYELQMAVANRSMAPDLETLFLAPSPEFSFLSSSLVREIASRGGDVSDSVPPAMLDALRRKFGPC